MRRQRRVLLGTLGLGLAALFTTAFTSGRAGDVQLGVVAQAGGPGDALAKLAKQYEATHTGIKVKVTLLQYDNVRERSIADFTSGKAAYDVVAYDYLWLKEYERGRFIVPLDPLIAKAGSSLRKDDFFKPYLTYGTLNGKLYGLPWLGAVYMLYYRRDLLAAKHIAVPKTWDEYAAAAQKLKSGNVAGSTLIGKRDDPLVDEFWSIAWSYGAQIYSGSKAAMNTPSALKALTVWKRIYKSAPRDALSADWPAAAATFSQGKAAMMLNFSDTSTTLLGPDSTVADTVGFAALPSGPTGKRTPNLGGWAIGVNSASKHQTEAFDFLAWATASQQQKTGLASGGSATRASVLADPGLQKRYPYFSAALSNYKQSVPFPQASNWVAWEAAMAPPLSEALGGQKTLSQGLKEANDRLSAEVKKEFG